MIPESRGEHSDTITVMLCCDALAQALIAKTCVQSTICRDFALKRGVIGS